MGTRWKIEFDARLPSNPEKERWTVGIAPRLLDVLQRNSHAVKQMRIMLVESVLEDTWAIFTGWSRPDTDGCFVYAGMPDRDAALKSRLLPA